MLAYREIARSAVLLASSLARSVSALGCSSATGSVDGTRAVQWQILCDQLLGSVCNI